MSNMNNFLFAITNECISEVKIKMTFALERERRQTAGNRLKRLLEQQEDVDDEFYGTAYGGFLDVRRISLHFVIVNLCL